MGVGETRKFHYSLGAHDESRPRRPRPTGRPEGRSHVNGSLTGTVPLLGSSRCDLPTSQPADARRYALAMIAIRVTRSGVEVALLRVFGYEVYDRHGWPRVREAPGETPGFAVDHGELQTEII